MTIDTALEGLTALLITPWYESHPLLVDLFSIIGQNMRESRSCVDWVPECPITMMHYLIHFTLDVNTCYISVEEESGEIDITNPSKIKLYLD